MKSTYGVYQSGEREVPHGLFNVSEQLSGE